MKTTIETINFPVEVKTKLKMKVSDTNLKFEFLSGHIIKFDKTNLSVREPHKVVVNNDNQALIALLYDDSDKVYLPNHNAIISFTKYIKLLNDIINCKENKKEQVYYHFQSQAIKTCYDFSNYNLGLFFSNSSVNLYVSSKSL